MDPVEQVKKLREDYERSLDAAESRRIAYHAAVLDLYRGGKPLREIARELGLSHQRVHQIVSGEPSRRSNLGRAAGAAAVVAVALVGLFGGLRLAHAPPFKTQPVSERLVRVPLVLDMQLSAATRTIESVGLRVRVVKTWHKTLRPHMVYAQGPLSRSLAEGSTVTLYLGRTATRG
jgi:hypothetical protein